MLSVPKQKTILTCITVIQRPLRVVLKSKIKIYSCRYRLFANTDIGLRSLIEHEVSFESLNNAEFCNFKQFNRLESKDSGQRAGQLVSFFETTETCKLGNHNCSRMDTSLVYTCLVSMRKHQRNHNF